MTFLISTNKIVYKRIDKICSKDNEFISLEKKSCIKCPPYFKKYSNFPFACYLKLDYIATFTKAKSDCEQNGGFLARPKSLKERNLFKELYGSSYFWVDSKITQLNEKYKWNDGTKVEGFYLGEPNNGLILNEFSENVLIISNGEFYGIQDSTQNNVLCQYN
ncbi:unnamed protein product [Brachionus calyciflorus]|uniref:C-type lectin domain-containing protein n=1 Tax=Brachionus calyciflorus TaxID=104777 RepID=A0A813PRP0_9BILA|nr:unnamed protein product [Brachionus calyciflorus]